MKKDKLSKEEYKVKKPHWYKIYISECVLCGIYDEYRERVYGEKPKDYNEIYTRHEYACEHHFL